MPDLTMAEREAKETNLKRIIEDAQRDLAALTGTAAPAKNGDKDNLKARADSEDSDAALFDRYSASGEIVKLSTENPERFKQLVDAKRLAGERALFERNFR